MQAWIHATIAIFMFIGACIVTIWRIGYIIGQREKKLDDKITNLALELEKSYKKCIYAVDKEQDDKRLALEKDQEIKRARVYQRFDEYKMFFEGQFVKKDMCALVHDHSSKEMTDVKAQMAILLEKVDELKNIILTQKSNAENRP